MPLEQPEHTVKHLLESLAQPPKPPTPLPLSTTQALITTLSSATSETLSAVLQALSQLPPSAIPIPLTQTLTNALLSILTRKVREDGVINITNTITLLAARTPNTAADVHSLNPYDVITRSHPQQSPKLLSALQRLSSITARPKRPNRAIKLLSLDGGGTRAVLTLEFLSYLTERIGPLHEYFDYIIGTSSGGVAALATGLLRLHPRELQKLYIELSKTLFKKRAVGMIRGRGLYDGQLVTEFARVVCGARRICFCDGAKVGVVSTRRGGVLPFLHTNYRSFGRYEWSAMHRLTDVIRATTAAPVLFEAYEDEAGHRFVDGGVVCNNPTAVGIHECMTLFPGCDVSCVVSVGSGRMEVNGGMSVARTVLWRMTDTEMVHHVLEDVVREYFRLNCDVRRMGLDVRGGSLEELIEIGRRWCTGAGTEVVERLCKRLEYLNDKGMKRISRL